MNLIPNCRLFPMATGYGRNHRRGETGHLKVFATPEAADEWFRDNDPEGVVFGYEVLE